MELSLKAVSESADSEDSERRRLASVLTIGLLNYIARDGAADRLTVTAEQNSTNAPIAPADDPWNSWVFSLEGCVSRSGEETRRETTVDGSVGADRITDDWKITTGLELQYQREDFELDEDEPFHASREEQQLEWLVVRSVNDHRCGCGGCEAGTSTTSRLA